MRKRRGGDVRVTTPPRPPPRPTTTARLLLRMVNWLPSASIVPQSPAPPPPTSTTTTNLHHHQQPPPPPTSTATTRFLARVVDWLPSVIMVPPVPLKAPFSFSFMPLFKLVATKIPSQLQKRRRGGAKDPLSPGRDEITALRQWRRRWCCERRSRRRCWRWAARATGLTARCAGGARRRPLLAGSRQPTTRSTNGRARGVKLWEIFREA